MNDKKKKILESLIEPFIEPIIKKVDTFDVRYFKRFENEIKNDIEKKFDDFDRDNASELIIDFLQNCDFQELINSVRVCNDEKRKSIINSDGRVELIFKLLERVDLIVPNISFLILSRIKPIEHIRKMCEPADLFKEVEKFDGEHRARVALRLFREVSEFVYDNYIRILWELTCVIKMQKNINSTGNFGQLINGLISRLKNENALELIDIDAGWIRNASSHARYTYQNSNDTLEMWDINKPKKLISVDNLISKATSMYLISSQLIFDIYICNIYKIILNNDLIDIILKEKNKILQLDTEVLNLIEKQFEKQFEKLIGIKIKR